MENQKQTQLFISNLMKKFNPAYIFSFVLLTSSLVFMMVHTVLSSDLCASVVSAMKFSIGRSHMFLLCNGILAILVKSSSSVSSSRSEDSGSDHISKAAEDCQRTVKQKQVTELSAAEQKQVELSAAEQKQVSELSADNVHFPTVEENVSTEVVMEEFESNEHYVSDDNDHGDHDFDEDEEDAEELNRRCEDFIRRMKQGIISESRQDHCLARFS